MRRVFLLAPKCLFAIHNGENARNWVANMVLKFHDDPTESEIVVFLRQIWWAAGKRKSFWEKGKGKRN